MPKDNRNFFEKKKDWSEIKDTLLGAYLKPYFQKILMTKHPVFYVDCFSGKGRFDDGKPGSPIIALNAFASFEMLINFNSFEFLERLAGF